MPSGRWASGLKAAKSVASRAVSYTHLYPVADILAKRGLPFVFVSGYGEGSLSEPYRNRPSLQKPFQAEDLKTTLAGLLSK